MEVKGGKFIYGLYIFPVTRKSSYVYIRQIGLKSNTIKRSPYITIEG